MRFPAGLGIERQDADCDLSPSVVSLAEIIIEAPGYLLSGTEIVITSKVDAPETVLDLVMDGGGVQTSSHILTIAGDIEVTAATDPFSLPSSNLLAGNFRLTKAAAELLVAQENDGVQIIGTLAGTGANSAAKRGNGQLWLGLATVALPLALELESGPKILISSTPANNPVEVSGGRLMGHGQIGAVTAGPGMTRRVLAPESNFETGTITCPSLTLNGFSELQLVPQNITPFVVNGSVNLNTAVLAYIHSGERAVAEGAVLTLISKTTAGPVTGTFNGLPEGARLMGTANHFLISYTGGDGNDVTLTAVRPTNSGTFVWDGEPIRCLCQPDPWVGNITPPPGAVLTLPDGAPPDAASRTITNGVGLLSRGIKHDTKPGCVCKNRARTNGAVLILLKEKQGASVRFEFYAITGKTHTIESSPDMKTWTRVDFSVAAPGAGSPSRTASAVGIFSAFATPTSPSTEFYRLTVR